MLFCRRASFDVAVELSSADLIADYLGFFAGAEEGEEGEVSDSSHHGGSLDSEATAREGRVNARAGTGRKKRCRG